MPHVWIISCMSLLFDLQVFQFLFCCYVFCLFVCVFWKAGLRRERCGCEIFHLVVYSPWLCWPELGWSQARGQELLRVSHAGAGPKELIGGAAWTPRAPIRLSSAPHCVPQCYLTPHFHWALRALPPVYSKFLSKNSCLPADLDCMVWELPLPQPLPSASSQPCSVVGPGVALPSAYIA